MHLAVVREFGITEITTVPKSVISRSAVRPFFQSELPDDIGIEHQFVPLVQVRLLDVQHLLLLVHGKISNLKL